MNTNRNVSFGSGIGPSGYEVESAIFTPEVDRPAGVSRSGVMRKLDDLKARTSMIKSNVQRSVIHAKSSARSGVSNTMTRVQSSMRNNPAMWAGIAAGSGFVLGMLGRLMQSRNEHRHMPQLIVIETSC